MAEDYLKMPSCDKVPQVSTATPEPVSISNEHASGSAGGKVPGHSFPVPEGNPHAPTPSISNGPPGHDDRP